MFSELLFRQHIFVIINKNNVHIISSIWKENFAENIWNSEKKKNYGEFDETMNQKP